MTLLDSVTLKEPSDIKVKVFSNTIVERLERQRISLRNERKNAMRRASTAKARGAHDEANLQRHRADGLLDEMRMLDAAIDLFNQVPGQMFEISLDDAAEFGFGLTETGARQAIG